MPQAMRKQWMDSWEKNILQDSRNRYCDKETGEELGWVVSPFLQGYYNGYVATRDPAWIDRFIDWSDSWIKRGVKEPDGYTGWPKADGAATSVLPGLFTDNEVGEAMALTPAVNLGRVILRTPDLAAKYGDKMRAYLALSEETFQKWESRGCWREVEGGGVWVAPAFGIDSKRTGWSSGYDRRETEGFTLPDNKQNLIAEWMLAMYDATGKQVYRDRAVAWFTLMLARMKLREGGKYYTWNYWEPAGKWDYKQDGSTKHPVSVHPNGAYYDTDVHAIVAAYQHGLVFRRGVIDRLLATNRDYMWNQKVQGAEFKRIDGGEPYGEWKKTPGVLWTALLPYDARLRSVFEAEFNPAAWGGLALTPWYVAFRSIRIQ